jgi:hypothetical protein
MITCLLEFKGHKREIMAEGSYTEQFFLDEAIDGEFFPASLPDASVILMASRRPKQEEGWNIKLRLGNAAPDGFNLHTLKLEEFDPKYGGRWNAGSNKRGGGTRLATEQYARRIADRFLRCTLRHGMTPVAVWRPSFWHGAYRQEQVGG